MLGGRKVTVVGVPEGTSDEEVKKFAIKRLLEIAEKDKGVAS